MELSHRSWWSSLGPHALAAGSLLTEPSPKLSIFAFYCCLETESTRLSFKLKTLLPQLP